MVLKRARPLAEPEGTGDSSASESCGKQFKIGSAQSGPIIGTVRHLFVKPARKVTSVQSRDTLKLIAFEGIQDDVHRNAQSPRHLLLQTNVTSAQVGVLPGKLRENLFLSLTPGAVWPPISGSVIKIGQHAALRITFACEPCGFGSEYAGVALADLGKMDSGRRGILATVLIRSNIHFAIYILVKSIHHNHT